MKRDIAVTLNPSTTIIGRPLIQTLFEMCVMISQTWRQRWCVDIPLTLLPTEWLSQSRNLSHLIAIVGYSTSLLHNTASNFEIVSTPTDPFGYVWYGQIPRARVLAGGRVNMHLGALCERPVVHR